MLKMILDRKHLPPEDWGRAPRGRTGGRGGSSWKEIWLTGLVLLAQRWAASCGFALGLYEREMQEGLTGSWRVPRLTNDGNAILREIEVAHPAAKSMIELARTQDEEVGDGTTSVIILGAYLLTHRAARNRAARNGVTQLTRPVRN